MRPTATLPMLFTAEFFQDSHRIEAAMREQAPATLVRTPAGLRVWVVTRYAEARAVLSDPTVHKGPGIVEVARRNVEADAHGAEAEFVAGLGGHMLASDPPDHTRLRRLVSRAFTPGRVEAMRPRVEEITAGLLAAHRPGDRVDLLDMLAFPLPITVISELLGVPGHDQDRFRALSNELVATLSPDAAAAVAGYLTELIAAKRADLGDDLLSALIDAHDGDDSDRLSEHELVSMAFLLMAAGFETTVNLIGNGVLALLTHPDQLAALRADRALLRGAVEELLRLQSPVDMTTYRYTTEPLDLGAVRIPADALVLVSLGAANRDEARFPGADTLDLTRPAGGHIAFGHGIHHCLGAPLARLEGEIAIGGLLDAFPGLSLAVPVTELAWRPSAIVHGLEKLPVVL
ncbi:cytochrome P450 [Kibdelosporangium persicum]|uniref:Hydroxylase n=1 Tax=Kibdelosporangium persicum TaxID=2698649 RepID=A0ABX2FDU5_9PSEU|nr:cytochrome P450 [Kibdelosporangium persicum]NRN69548.1 Hydroxylase [Kibdelosporangium persicum]